MEKDATVPGRSCGTCALCCILPDIDELSKPANVVCHHCSPGLGCRIYPERPRLCADFHCRWLADEALSLDWEPQLSHMMIYDQGVQITVLVDPAHPDAWKAEPYRSHLSAWARAGERHGGYVIVFVGDEVIKIEPDQSPGLTA